MLKNFKTFQKITKIQLLKKNVNFQIIKKFNFFSKTVKKN